MFQDFQAIKLPPDRPCWNRSQLARFAGVSRTTIRISELICLGVPDFNRVHRPGQTMSRYMAWCVLSVAFTLKKINGIARGSSYRLELAKAIKQRPEPLSYVSYQIELEQASQSKAA